MGAFDKIVAAVSPRRACEREAWRQQLEILRGYDAAGYGRLNAGWRVHNESAEVTDRFSRDVVRALSLIHISASAAGEPRGS